MSGISMIGFKNLDDSEIQAVQEIILNSLNKINKKVNTEEISLIKVELKQHKHAKEFIHEIKTALFIRDKRLSSSTSHKNMYKAVREAMNKLSVEIEHLKKFKK